MSNYRPQKTPMLTAEQAVSKRRWLLIDAEGKVLGRLASEIARVLLGKHRPDYTPHSDSGDCVMVINAEKVIVTGGKEEKKIYYHHTGWNGGLKAIPYAEMMEKHPERILERTVKGMLQRGGTGKRKLKRLRCIVGNKHGMEAQQPIEIAL